MDNIVEVVTLLRRQYELELQLINGEGTAVATEHALEAIREGLIYRGFRAPTGTWTYDGQ